MFRILVLCCIIAASCSVPLAPHRATKKGAHQRSESLEYVCNEGDTHYEDCESCRCTHFKLRDGRVIQKGDEVVNDYVTRRKLQFRTIDNRMQTCQPGRERRVSKCWLCICDEDRRTDHCSNIYCED